MAQTAMQWLEQSIAKQSLLVFMHVQELGFFEQAKQMEKEQISEAYRTGVEEDVYNNPLRTGEQYYNETFNK